MQIANFATMYIYNITLKVDWSIHDRWLRWMSEDEIPRMLETGYFTKHQMMHLLEIDEEDGPTYAIQYQTESLEHYQNYMKEQSPVDTAHTYAMWGQQCLFFTTLMEIID